MRHYEKTLVAISAMALFASYAKAQTAACIGKHPCTQTGSSFALGVPVATSQNAEGILRFTAADIEANNFLRSDDQPVQQNQVRLPGAFDISMTAQELIYDGSNTPGAAQLESADGIGSGLPKWMRTNNIQELNNNQGLIYRDAGSLVATGANLVVDYTTGTAPGFVIGGYSESSGNAVEHNTVTIKRGDINGPVFGGVSHQTLKGSDVTGPSNTYDVTGTSDVRLQNINISATNNRVIVGADARVVANRIVGSYASIVAQAGKAVPGETVTPSDGIWSRAHSYASMAGSSVTAEGSHVTVEHGASVEGGIYGGYADISLASGNANASPSRQYSRNHNGYIDVSASSSASVSNTTATASGNTVTVGNNASVNDAIRGGYASIGGGAGSSRGGTANIVTTTSNVNASANSGSYGSFVIDNSTVTANGNTVVVGNAAVLDAGVLGGDVRMTAGLGEVIAGKSSSVSTYSTEYSSAYAGASSDYYIRRAVITASGNTVMLGDGVSVRGSIYGGFALIVNSGGSVVAGEATVQSINNNADAYASASSRSQTDMKVTVSDNEVWVGKNASLGGGYFTGSLYGGYAFAFIGGWNVFAGQVNALGTIENSADSSIIATSSTITVSNNNVTAGSGTVVNGSLYGGYAGISVRGGTAKGGVSNSGIYGSAKATISANGVIISANDNTVTFDGILQNGSIYGGYAGFEITQGTATLADGSAGDNRVDLQATQAYANNNTVTIGDNARITDTTGSLYGGYLAYNEGFAPAIYDVFTGNTLNYSAKNPARFNTVANFEHYNFTLNPSHANKDIALITADHIVLGTDASNLSEGAAVLSTIEVVGIHSGAVLNTGDEFGLMKAVSSFTANAEAPPSSSVAQQGISLLYDVQTLIDPANQQVTAVILGSKSGDDGHNNGGNYPAARVNPQLKALSEGYLAGAMLVNRGADVVAYNVFNAIHRKEDQALIPFVIASGDHTRYNTGSHIKSNDFLLTGGLTYQHDHWTTAAFVEGGWGSYDTYNSFYNAANVNGDGHSRYYGVGVFGRYDFSNGFYSDGSLRLGRSHNKFDTTDIQNLATGEYARYALKSGYASAHIGAGYIIALDEENQIDLSAKYLWTSLGGKDAHIAGDHIHFDRINSKRIRLNAEVNHQYSHSVSLRGGLGYEYEFDGKAEATTYGVFRIDAPGVRGSTGIVSVGATINPEVNQRLYLDIDAHGYTGKRRGLGATLQLRYAF